MKANRLSLNVSWILPFLAFLLAPLAQAAHAGPNPDLPQGRLERGPFFDKYPSTASWALVTEVLVPNNDFGVKRAGEQFGNGWIVAAKGTRDGLNHKTYRGPQAILICTVPSKDGKGKGQELQIPPDGGCG